MQKAAAKPQPRRPDIDLELARVVETLNYINELPSSVDVAGAARALSYSMSLQPADAREADPAECFMTQRRTVCALLTNFALNESVAAVDCAEQDFAAQCGLTGSFRTDDAQRLALEAVGIALPSIDAEHLAPYRRRLAVRALERLRRLMRAERHLRENLRCDLDACFSSAERKARSESFTALARLGVDAQLVLDGVVRFEAGRHINLIRHQANKLAGSYAGYDAEDLFGWGYRGLLAALLNYDPSQWAFSTYACTRIVGAIQDGVRQESPVPKRLGTYARQVRDVQARLGQRLGREPDQEELTREVALERLRRELGRLPTVAELAERICSEEKTLALLPRLASPASLDELFSDGETGLAGDVPDPADQAVRELARHEVRQAIAGLPHEEAQAVILLDIQGLTLEEAGRHTGATTRQLRSRRDRGRAQLSRTLSDWA